MSQEKEEQLITIPLKDFLWCMLGDETTNNNIPCNNITSSIALVLSNVLKDSMLYKVELDDMDGAPLRFPKIWRYADYQSEYSTFVKRKRYAHKLRVEREIECTNVDHLTAAIIRASKMNPDHARMVAYKIVRTNNHELMKAMGATKIVTKEEEL